MLKPLTARKWKETSQVELTFGCKGSQIERKAAKFVFLAFGSHLCDFQGPLVGDINLRNRVDFHACQQFW